MPRKLSAFLIGLERGENGHNTFLLYDSVIHIPLLISAARQTERQDFHSLTSNIDLLQTLLNIAGKDIPSSLEGSFCQVLAEKKTTLASVNKPLSLRNPHEILIDFFMRSSIELQKKEPNNVY